MGPAIIVTVGILFLVQEYSPIGWDTSWPVLLIVIGLLLFAGHNVSMEGHVQPWWVRGKTPEPPFDENSPRQTETDQQVKL